MSRKPRRNGAQLAGSEAFAVIPGATIGQFWQEFGTQGKPGRSKYRQNWLLYYHYLLAHGPGITGNVLAKVGLETGHGTAGNS